MPGSSIASDQQGLQARILMPCLADNLQPIDPQHGIVDDQQVDRTPFSKMRSTAPALLASWTMCPFDYQKLAEKTPHIVIVVADQDFG